MGQAATWLIDVLSKVQIEADKNQGAIIERAKEAFEESGSVYHATTNKGHSIVIGATSSAVGSHVQDLLIPEKFAEAENALMLGAPGLPISAH